MRVEKSFLKLTVIFIAAASACFSSDEQLPLTVELAHPTSAEIFEELLTANKAPSKHASSDVDGYTINYNTVSIVEYIRFASKICNVNFIFNEQDLNFTVTVVSEDPITPNNVMATLVQILRIHNLQLLEQGNNLVIHNNDSVKQLATVVEDGEKAPNAPIVTRIFRVQNIKPDSIVAIVKPMISANAIIETSPETRQVIITDVTANVDKVATLIASLDSPHSSLQVGTYEAKNSEAEYLISLSQKIMEPIAQGNPYIMVPVGSANSIYIVSIPELTAQTIELLKTLDTPAKRDNTAERRLNTKNVRIYQLHNQSPDQVKAILDSLPHNLRGVTEGDLNKTLKSGWVASSHSLGYTGSTESLDKIGEFISGIDSQESPVVPPNTVPYFVYKPTHRTAQEVHDILRDTASGLNDNTPEKGILNSSHVNTSSNTITFKGTDLDIPGVRTRINDLIATADAADTKGASHPKNSFYLFKIKHSNYEQIRRSLKKASELDNSDDLGLSEMLDKNHMFYISDSNSILFKGPAPTIRWLQDMLPSLDVASGSLPNSDFIMYKPKHLKGPALVAALKAQLGQLNGKLSDQAMIETLDKNVSYDQKTNILIITGDKQSLDRIQKMIDMIDVPETRVKTAYYVPVNGRADDIEDDLNKWVKTYNGDDKKEVNRIVKEQLQYVKGTNTFYISGDTDSVDTVLDMLQKYDIARKPTGKTTFIKYKPQSAKASDINKSLDTLYYSLKKQNLDDPDLLNTIDPKNREYDDTTNTFYFTGTPASINALQDQLKEIDSPKAIHRVGKKLLLVYKIQNPSAGPQLFATVKGLANKSPNKGDDEVNDALNSVTYIREAHSLTFRGTDEALKEVEAIVSKLDVGGMASAPSPSAAIKSYHFSPKVLEGPKLIAKLKGYAETQSLTGVSNNDFQYSISKMHWSEDSKMILYPATEETHEEIAGLLKDFDNAANLPTPPAGDINIQIDNTSFHVFKLQFHKGDEIQGALRQIAKDLILSNAPVNQNLLNAINSIQWLEITNSLLCTGDNETLTRLGELIKNLDVPLKQVFIEMLVIQTSMTNALTFGLEWGSKYQYKDKFGATFNNFQPQTVASGDTFTGADPLASAMQSLNSTTTPTATGVPVAPGFDLGIIGEVIRHGGDTFLTIGSLVNALQVDNETSVVMTPKLITQDGRTSSIFQGNNIPFAGSFVSSSSGGGSSGGSGSLVGTTNIEYRDIGINLTITPVLGNSDIVTLDISLDQTSTAANAQAQQINLSSTTGLPTSINGIQTSKTTMQTTVHVPDDHFLILSGMVNNSSTKQKTGMPCLGGLPFIGAAFSTDNNLVNNTNIVIFLRPHILNSMEDITRLNRTQEEFFREQSGTPLLEHTFNEAMEFIKTVDDE